MMCIAPAVAGVLEPALLASRMSPRTRAMLETAAHTTSNDIASICLSLRWGFDRLGSESSSSSGSGTCKTTLSEVVAVGKSGRYICIDLVPRKVVDARSKRRSGRVFSAVPGWTGETR